MSVAEAERILQAACALADVDYAGTRLLRAGENTLFVLPHGIVARVTRPGQADVARKEVAVSRWLASISFPVVETVEGITQPVNIEGRAVTFWRELPPHRPGTPQEVGILLRVLHALVPPAALTLPKLNPFVRLENRITESTVMRDAERAWLLTHLAQLQVAWTTLPDGMPWCALHGDAWGANFAVAASQVVMLDLERFAYGPPEWDLAAIAVDYESFSAMTAADWDAVCAGYGCDVRLWAGYPTLRSIRELRKVTFAFQTAERLPEAAEQARYRLACIQGQRGERPWNWAGVV